MNDTTKPDSNAPKTSAASPAGGKGKPASSKPAGAPPAGGKPPAGSTAKPANPNRKRLIIAGIGIAAALAAVPAFNHFNKPKSGAAAPAPEVSPTVASGKIKDAPPPPPAEAPPPSPVAAGC